MRRPCEVAVRAPELAIPVFGINLVGLVLLRLPLRLLAELAAVRSARLRRLRRRAADGVDVLCGVAGGCGRGGGPVVGVGAPELAEAVFGVYLV